MVKKKVALLVGGDSHEREVSLNTGKSFADALEKLGYPFQVIEAGANLSADLIAYSPDLALLALHGRYGEDGTVQGLLEHLKIPYSSTGVLGSALCMNKGLTKQICRQNEIPTADYFWYREGEDKESFLAQLPEQGSFVFKPAREGSSFGVTICQNGKGFREGLSEALRFDSEALAEAYLPGAEIAVAVLGGRAHTPIEVSPQSGFYDYESKYTEGKSDYFLPARLPQKMLDQLCEWALLACRVCQVRIYARVDFKLNAEGRAFLMEINTQPGCTPTSLFPKSAAFDGISFEQVIEKLVLSSQLDYQK